MTPDGGRTDNEFAEDAQDVEDIGVPLTLEKLWVELVRTRKAIRQMREALTVRKRWAWLVRGLVAALVAVSAVVWLDAHRRDNQLEDLARAGFINNCEASNANLRRINAGDLEQAEILAAAARRGENPNTAAVEAYLADVRRSVQEREEQIRDCDAEVDEAFQED